MSTNVKTTKANNIVQNPEQNPQPPTPQPKAQPAPQSRTSNSQLRGTSAARGTLGGGGGCGCGRR